MSSATTFFYNILNNKRAGWVVIVIATAAKALLGFVFNSYESDKSFYLLMAKSVGEGEGFTIPVTVLNLPGVTEYVYHPSAITAVYSLVAAPLLQLFPGDYLLVTWLIELLSWFLLFLVLRQLLYRLTFNHFWSNAFILFSGFFLYNIELSSSYKDIPALTVLFIAVLQCMKIIRVTGRVPFTTYLFSAALFLLPGLIKLTYLPLAFVFPVTIVYIAFLKKQRSLLLSAAILFLASGLFVAAHHFFFQYYASRSYGSLPAYYWNYWSISSAQNDFIPGFYPKNILQMYPFIPAAFFNIDTVGVQLESHAFPLFKLYATALRMILFAGVSVMVAGFLYLSTKTYRKNISERLAFLFVGSIVAFSVILSLSVMSARHQPIIYKGNSVGWTYVQEIRAFLFPMIFLQICLFAFLFSKQISKPLLKWTRNILLVIAGVSFLHGVSFVFKTFTRVYKKIERPVSLNQKILQLADSTQQQHPGKKNVWLATEMPHLDWYSKLKGQKTLNNLLYLNDTAFQLPVNTILFTAIAREDTVRISKYLQRPQVKQYQSFEDAFFIFIERNDQ